MPGRTWRTHRKRRQCRSTAACANSRLDDALPDPISSHSPLATAFDCRLAEIINPGGSRAFVPLTVLIDDPSVTAPAAAGPADRVLESGGEGDDLSIHGLFPAQDRRPSYRPRRRCARRIVATPGSAGGGR